MTSYPSPYSGDLPLIMAVGRCLRRVAHPIPVPAAELASQSRVLNASHGGGTARSPAPSLLDLIAPRLGSLADFLMSVRKEEQRCHKAAPVVALGAFTTDLRAL